MSLRRFAAVLGMLLTLAACGGSGSDPSPSTKKARTFGVYGKVTLKSSSIEVDGLADCINSSDEIGATDCAPKSGDSCNGTDGFEDIRNGAQVTVSDSSGKNLALGELSDGALTEDAAGWPFEDTFVCQFTINVDDVPSSDDIYSLAIGKRDSVNFEKSDASSLSLDLSD